jgi:hypothetical protein
MVVIWAHGAVETRMMEEAWAERMITPGGGWPYYATYQSPGVSTALLQGNSNSISQVSPRFSPDSFPTIPGCRVQILALPPHRSPSQNRHSRGTLCCLRLLSLGQVPGVRQTEASKVVYLENEFHTEVCEPASVAPTSQQVVADTEGLADTARQPPQEPMVCTQPPPLSPHLQPQVP